VRQRQRERPPEDGEEARDDDGVVPVGAARRAGEAPLETGRQMEDHADDDRQQRRRAGGAERPPSDRHADAAAPFREEPKSSSICISAGRLLEM
jgi:hypothetical protein